MGGEEGNWIRIEALPETKRDMIFYGYEEFVAGIYCLQDFGNVKVWLEVEVKVQVVECELIAGDVK